jgi:hypothetical protein
MLSLLLFGALARSVGPQPTDDDWHAHVSLVDDLGWAATDRQVDRYLDGLRSEHAVLARSLAAGFRHRMRTDGVPFHAAEVQLIEDIPGPRPRRLVHVRQAVVVPNTARVPIEEITFRLLANGVHRFPGSARVLDTRMATRPIPHTLDGTLLTVSLPEPVRPGRSARVMIELVAELPPIRAVSSPDDPDALPIEAVGGVGFTEERVHLAGVLPVVTPLSADGRFESRELPTNGEGPPFDPAHFHVVVDAPADYVVAGSGVELASTEGADGRRSTVLGAALSRDMAVVMGRDLTVQHVEVGDTTLRVLYPDDEALMGRQLVRWSQQALSTLTDTYGPLSMAEVDVVEAPLHVALGLELPGIALVDLHHKTGSYLRQPHHPLTVSHELAHQWWSAEVGSDSMGSPWIDEALASHGAALVLESQRGRGAVERLYDDDVRGPTQRLREEGLDDLPADLPGDAYDLWRYSVIVYGRAALFVDRVRSELGPEAFSAAMKQLVAEQRGRRITADELLEVWTRHADDPARIEALHRRWITEAHAYEDLLESP